MLVLHYRPGGAEEARPAGRLTLAHLVNLSGASEPSLATAAAPELVVAAYMAAAAGQAALLANWLPNLLAGAVLPLCLAQLGLFLMGLLLGLLWLQPRSREELTFTTPLVPLLPALAIFVNIYLMMKLFLLYCLL